MKTIAQIVLSVLQTVFGGFIFALFWNWFVCRTFPGAPHIGFKDGVGLLFVAGFPLLSVHLAKFQEKLAEMNEKLDNKLSDGAVSIFGTVFILAVLYPVILLTGWVWHVFLG